ncbi:hypothetical protein RRG08_030890 [Elysia crispata]|uniref:Uncharacterized protein n=1 Tax=Elysia crispata TaxID=231223 RepID=A0AAE0XT76_9GAST|nr:hypothetical protein RRG08_030890 [Elysia crispata]
MKLCLPECLGGKAGVGCPEHAAMLGAQESEEADATRNCVERLSPTPALLLEAGEAWHAISSAFCFVTLCPI